MILQSLPNPDEYGFGGEITCLAWPHLVLAGQFGGGFGDGICEDRQEPLSFTKYKTSTRWR